MPVRELGLNYYKQSSMDGKSSGCIRKFFASKIVCQDGGEGPTTCMTVSYRGDKRQEISTESLHRPGRTILIAFVANSRPLRAATVTQLQLDSGVSTRRRKYRSSYFTTDRAGWLLQGYLERLRIQLECDDNELWIDLSSGFFCRGPEGPACKLRSGGLDLEQCRPSTEFFNENTLIRYLATLDPALAVSRSVLQWLSSAWVPDSPGAIVYQPSVLSISNNIIIAVAAAARDTKAWESRSDCLGKGEMLPNGLTRFSLKDKGRWLRLVRLDWAREKVAWFAQASSIFHAHGISLEDDLSVYKLVLPKEMTGGLSKSIIKHRRRQSCPPIYLFVPSRSIEIFWSFDEDGRIPISHDLCKHLGLPTKVSVECWQCSWQPQMYKTLRDYQAAKRFDPTTTDFAREVGFDGPSWEVVLPGARPESVCGSGEDIGPPPIALHAYEVDAVAKSTPQEDVALPLGLVDSFWPDAMAEASLASPLDAFSGIRGAILSVVAHLQGLIGLLSLLPCFLRRYHTTADN
ncbi:hypothetical protein V5O48_012037 [Marasmius crinis-equi]|uniref:Uncharacterized protein n=1 Tax=Marasmius crinis-equi TaxID=585013 RepID=A0ABR3F3V8_9AGAR